MPLKTTSGIHSTQRRQVKFLPVLASRHCSNSTLEWYTDNAVDVVPKNINPPNCPELRPIEFYRVITKNKLSKNVGSVYKIYKMRLKWNKYASFATLEAVQDMMTSIKIKTRAFISSIGL